MSKQASQYPVSGSGLGLRRPLMDKLMAEPPTEVDSAAKTDRMHGGRDGLGNLLHCSLGDVSASSGV